MKCNQLVHIQNIIARGRHLFFFFQSSRVMFNIWMQLGHVVSSFIIHCIVQWIKHSLIIHHFLCLIKHSDFGGDLLLSLVILLNYTVTGFKLFPNFRRSDDSESSQSPQQTPAKDLNCISSFSELFVGELTGNEPGKFFFLHISYLLSSFGRDGIIYDTHYVFFFLNSIRYTLCC